MRQNIKPKQRRTNTNARVCDGQDDGAATNTTRLELRFKENNVRVAVDVLRETASG